MQTADFADLTDLSDLQTLQRAIAADPDRWRPLVFTNGCFDLLHVGHLTLLREARAQGGHGLGPRGEHGLPLMGGGDWNDGMNRVGHHGPGFVVQATQAVLALEPQGAALAQANRQTGQGPLAHEVRQRAVRGDGGHPQAPRQPLTATPSAITSR